MEKYYRVSDINEIIKKLAKEPAYYHEGEDFYNGVCAVEGELMCLDTIELEERRGFWGVAKTYNEYTMSYDIKTVCSLCAHVIGYEGCVVKSNFCPNCGAKMIKE
jgi:hypothetical protein